MSQEHVFAFDPKKDFLAPIGVFAEHLLGRDIESTRWHTASVQALFVVFEKYLLEDKDITFENPADIEGQKKKYKDDFFFYNMEREYFDLKNQLVDTVPDNVDIADEIKQAQELVNSGQGVPNVPPFGMILAKRLPKDIVNSCLQVQAGLRIIAIADQWEGYEKIVAARVFDNDPEELKLAQTTLNDVRENRADKNENDLQWARAFGLSAIANAQGQLIKTGQSNAVEALDAYLESQQGVIEKFTANKTLQDYFRAAPLNGTNARADAPGAK